MFRETSRAAGHPRLSPRWRPQRDLGRWSRAAGGSPPSRTRCGSSCRSWLLVSINVALVAASMTQFLESVLTEHVSQCTIHVAGHALFIAADIHVRALAHPAAQFMCVLGDAVLDVDLLGLVAGERDIDAAQRSASEVILPFELIEEVGRVIARTEE